MPPRDPPTREVLTPSSSRYLGPLISFYLLIHGHKPIFISPFSSWDLGAAKSIMLLEQDTPYKYLLYYLEPMPVITRRPSLSKVLVLEP